MKVSKGLGGVAAAVVVSAICLTCGKPGSEHFGLKRDCPLSKAIKPGNKFKEAA